MTPHITPTAAAAATGHDPSAQAPATPAAPTGTARWLPLLRTGLVAYVFAGAAALVLLFTGSCNSTDTVEQRLSEQNELTTEQEVQNVVSFPFRVAGGVVVYPLKFMFIDLPNEIAGAFEDEMSAVRKRLESEAEQDREMAVAELRRSRSPKAVPLLVRALHDAEANIRRDASLALKALGPDLIERGEPLLPKVLRDAGREDLAQMSVEALLIARMRRDNSAVVRASCAAALGTLGTAATSLPALRRAYERELEEGPDDAFVPSYILLARGQLGDLDAEAEALAHLERARHPVHYGNALLTLAHLRVPSAEAELRRALAHPEQRIVIAAITGYGIAGEFGTLISLARDGTAAQREHALISLGSHGGLAYIGVLEQYRTHSNPRLQRAAIFGMAAARYPRVVPHLIPMLQSVSVVTRLQALSFLVELTGRDLGPEPRPWQDWWNRRGGSYVERAQQTQDH